MAGLLRFLEVRDKARISSGVGYPGGALAYSRNSTRFRNAAVNFAGPVMLAALVAAAIVPRYGLVMAAWALIGAG